MILVCTATQIEHDAVVAGLRDSGATGLEVLNVGVGPLHAGKKLRQRLMAGPAPSRIVSAGFAGMVSGGVPFASWITAEKLWDWDGDSSALTELSLAAPTPLDAVLIGMTRCELVSTDHLVTHDSKLYRLVPTPSKGPLAVDMESVALAREADARGIPFTVARLVSDTPAHPLPEFLAPITAAMTSEGALARVTHAARGVRAALGDPRGVARLVLEGKSWTRRLRAGWSTLADALTASEG